MGKLEKVISDRVQPILDDAMVKYLGVTIREINADISDKLLKNPLFEFEVNTRLPYRKAKEEFRKIYLARLLRLNFGNVSAVAAIAGIDRRSIHRLIKRYALRPDQHRKDMLSGQYIKAEAVHTIIEQTIDQYRDVLRPERLQALYSNLDGISREIIKELPEEPLTLKEAEKEFQRRYLIKVMQEERVTSRAAKRLGIRYETLHRKLKK